jgi:phosphoadenosine phosphosulfate reductase
MIVKRGFPTRMTRWCCEYLKEKGGKGRIVVTGIRWDESRNRSKRKTVEIVKRRKEKQDDMLLFEDNVEGRMMFENCKKKGKRMVNAIIEWTTDDVWEFIKLYNIPYCCLYDEGFKRVGCIMCPMSGKRRAIEKNRYPKITAQFIKSFNKLYEKRNHQENFKRWESGEDMFNWWLYEKDYVPPNHLKLF